MKLLIHYYNYYKLAIKYYAQGDSWYDAKRFADYLIKGNWRNN